MWAEALDLLLARLRPRADLRRVAAVSGSAPMWMDSSTAPPPELCSPPAAPRPSPSGSNAFEERGDAILNLLSPPNAIFLPRCLFCWRRHRACTMASARHKCFCLALLDSVDNSRNARGVCGLLPGGSSVRAARVKVVRACTTVQTAAVSLA